MESVIAALVTGVLTLIGVIVSNSRSRAVMEVKIDNLTRQVEKHNCLIERTYALEQDVAVVKTEIDNMKKVK
jgi:outer membrane murein-binding lipoprotein Lpp